MNNKWIHDTPGFPLRADLKHKAAPKPIDLLRSSSKEFNPLDAELHKQSSNAKSHEEFIP